MLAVVTTDYPLEPGEAIEFLRPGGRDELQRDLGRRRALDERLRDPARERRERDRADARDRRGVRARPRRGVRRPRASRSSPTARASPCSPRSRSRGAVDDAQAKAIARRIATSPLVKTALFGHDANWGRVLDGRRLGAATTAATRASTPTRITLALQRHGRARRGRADRRRAGRLERPSCTIELDLGLGDGAAELPDDRPLLRLRPHQRGLPDMSRVVVKVGGAVAGRRRERSCSSSRASDAVCVVHGAGPQISAEMERAGIHVEFVGGRRVTTRGRARDRSRLVRSRQRGALRGDRRRAPCRSSATRSASQPTPVPELGLVGEALPSRPAGRRAPRSTRADPGRRAARGGPAERQRRRGRGRARDRPRRRAAALPHRRRGPAARRRGRRRRSTAPRPSACSTRRRSTAGSSRSSARRSPPLAAASPPRSARTAVLA